MFPAACYPKSQQLSGGVAPPAAPVITSVTPGTDGGNPVLTFTFTAAVWDIYTYEWATDIAFSDARTGADLGSGTVGGTQEINDPFARLLPNTVYFIRMRVFRGGLPSAYSNTASGTTPAGGSLFLAIPDCIMQCLASQLTGIITGAPVLVIPDTSTGGSPMDQVTNTPTYQTDSGAPSVRFLRAFDALWTATNFTVPCTFVVMGRMNPTAENRLFAGRVNNWLLGWYSGQMQNAYFEGDVHLSGITTDNNFHVAIGTISSTKAEFWWDGIKIDSKTGTFAAPNGLGVNANEPSNCDFKAQVAYSRVLTDLEIAQAFTIASGL